MKTWAKWTLLILWTVLLLCTSSMWNPFASFPALLKYSVVSVIASAIFGALVILIQYFLLISIIFPLPPRADSKAPKSIFRRFVPFLFKESHINPKAPTRLNELIGNDSAKQEIVEAMELLSNPKRYEASGAQVPKGMLFVGPPGVGKTLFARAMANEIGIPFYVVEGSSLSGLFMGLGVLKLKTLFGKLRKHDKAILFIDEIDSIGSRRQTDKGFGGVSDMNMTLNTLLTEMDGFVSSNILVIGATNNDGVLDPALTRAGRMDRRIYFQLPGPEERKILFQYYLAKVSCALQIDLDDLAQLTTNFSPAEIANIVNEAALMSQRPGGAGKVTTEIVEQAIDRISVGLERSIIGSGLETTTHDPSIRLNDVIGVDDVKQDALEIVDFLQHGEELRKIGAKLPKGLLFVGPPGVGKTMLAKAIANEAGVPFYGLSGSNLKGGIFTDSVGQIKALYAQARKSPAAIVFIDEIDAIGGIDQGRDRLRSNALNQMLVELDGLGRSNVITIGATNNEQSLDPAFMRSGRFDRKCYIGLPDAEARKKIFARYLRNIQLASEPDLERLGKQTTNFSGADISAAVNEAAIIAVRNGKKHVEESDLEEAVDRVSVTAGHKLNTMGINMARVPDIEVRLSDIKGMEEAKSEAAEVVSLLQNADIIKGIGLKSPKGVLLIGPPGVGKTMLAKAIANEAGVPFYAISGSDFNTRWAGVGSDRVRAIYEQARRSGKPSIVFIDEIDALGGKRGVDTGGGAIQDSNKTLNQFLVELDGFGKHKILTIGATNHPDLLDSALLRPGRFDRKIKISLPSLEGREAILRHYLAKVKIDSTVNITEVARATTGCSGADLANIVNEAGLSAARDGKANGIAHNDLIQAIQRVTFGMSYHMKALTQELKATAYHEAGHALVAYFRNKRDRIQMVTIVPAGGALGYVWRAPKEDFHSTTKIEYLTAIEISLGGYCAENLHMETTTSGVQDDLDKVAGMARAMVTEWGMGSYKFNVSRAYGDRYTSQASPETQRQIELEIKAITDQCLANVNQLLVAKRKELDLLAQAIYDKETLYFKDIVAILEPTRHPADVERELTEVAERKLVGKVPKVVLEPPPVVQPPPLNPGPSASNNKTEPDS